MAPPSKMTVPTLDPSTVVNPFNPAPRERVFLEVPRIPKRTAPRNDLAAENRQLRARVSETQHALENAERASQFLRYRLASHEWALAVALSSGKSLEEAVAIVAAQGATEPSPELSALYMHALANGVEPPKFDLARQLFVMSVLGCLGQPL